MALADDATRILRQFSAENATTTVCLATRDFGRLQLTRGVAEAFRLIVEGRAGEIAEEVGNGERHLVEYDASNPPVEYETEVIRISPGGHLHDVTTALANPAAIPMFGNSTREFNQLRFHCTILQRRGRLACIGFRLFTRSRALHRSKKLALIFRDGSYDLLTDPVFTFDQGIDCFCISDLMFVVKKDNFHRIFSYFAEARANAQQTLAAINSAVPIRNYESFAEKCTGNSIILMKLRSIANRPYFGQIDAQTLIATINREGLDIDVGAGPNGPELVYRSDDPYHHWTLVKLLDDGYLRSDMTGTSYEVTGKRAR